MTLDRGLLSAIVEASNDAIVGTTLDGIITTWNSAAERLFGFPVAEASGQSLWLIFSQHHQGDERSLLLRVARGESIKRYETVCASKDGAKINVSLNLSPIRDES